MMSSVFRQAAHPEHLPPNSPSLDSLLLLPDVSPQKFASRLMQFLQGLDPEKFAALNVLEDEGLRQGIKEYSEWPTIPQLYVNKEFIGGCDILIGMHQSGELAKVLEENKVLVEASS
ncbi:hypothetical protein DID88_006877 [Monilinia fructigena]|uniref:Glutaredoxin domain-containing protein n=1 Tax=Monilinia fructigena TaxID=38457 RepID=A0A395IIV7_9HELO|nr:hypothetical protein DID88_006877 [Monilinia fructigena]